MCFDRCCYRDNELTTKTTHVYLLIRLRDRRIKRMHVDAQIATLCYICKYSSRVHLCCIVFTEMSGVLIFTHTNSHTHTHTRSINRIPRKEMIKYFSVKKFCRKLLVKCWNFYIICFFIFSKSKIYLCFILHFNCNFKHNAFG